MDIFRSLRSLALPSGSTCVALGFFDGLHVGHMAVLGRMLEDAAAYGLTPLVFTFSTARRAPESKGRVTYLLSGGMMDALLEEMGVEQVVCPDFDEFRNLSAEQFVRDVLSAGLGAARVVCGYDFRFGKDAAGDTDRLRALCGDMDISAALVPAVLVDGEPVASRRIRAFIEAGDIIAANRLFGRAFAIDFEVIAGRRLGRTLDWPTINQAFPEGFTLPRFGVYATATTVEGKRYGSVTNVGVKPTVGSDVVLSETWIQGFSGDIYGRRIKVEFLEFLRPEQKFPDLEALKQAISTDARRASEIVSGYKGGE